MKNVQTDLGETAAKVLEFENKMESLTLDGGIESGENGVHTEKMQKQIDDMSEFWEVMGIRWIQKSLR